MLKEQLTNIKSMDAMQMKQMNSHEIEELLKKMTINIGSVDPELRDTLIYRTFDKLIMLDILSDAQMTDLLKTCMGGHHLFLKIGTANDDAVFTRSFSSLVIALILVKDKSRRFLTDAILRQVFEKINLYMREEEDTRGYVIDKGWAHSIAHGADLLAAAVSHSFYSSEWANEFIETVHMCLFKRGCYINEEDERLIFIIDELTAKGLSEQELESWVVKIFKELEVYRETHGYSLEFFQLKTNVLNFAKTLYFRLGNQQVYKDAKNQITININSWHKKIYLNPV